MKRLPLILLVLFSAFLASRVVASVYPAPEPYGQYLEARSASVWCGPCHHAGEVGQMGRNGIAAWSFEGGGVQGYDLADVRVVALLSHPDENLAECGTPVKASACFVIDAPDEATAAAARTWVQNRLMPSPNPSRTKIVMAEISFLRDGHFFRVASTGLFELRGDAIADGSCCSQPENRWYSTFDEGILELAIVGVPDVCEVNKQGDIGAWRHADENNVQLSSF
jgi:hypothetical protein